LILPDIPDTEPDILDTEATTEDAEPDTSIEPDIPDTEPVTRPDTEPDIPDTEPGTAEANTEANTEAEAGAGGKAEADAEDDVKFVITPAILAQARVHAFVLTTLQGYASTVRDVVMDFTRGEAVRQTVPHRPDAAGTQTHQARLLIINAQTWATVFKLESELPPDANSRKAFQ
jgi:hypothetical protein